MSQATESPYPSSPDVSSLSGTGIAVTAKALVRALALVSAQRALANRAESEAALSRRNVDAVRAMYVGEGWIERGRSARNETAQPTPSVAAPGRFDARFSIAGVVIAFSLLLFVADRVLF